MVEVCPEWLCSCVSFTMHVWCFLHVCKVTVMTIVLHSCAMFFCHALCVRACVCVCVYSVVILRHTFFKIYFLLAVRCCLPYSVCVGERHSVFVHCDYSVCLGGTIFNFSHSYLCDVFIVHCVSG